MYFDDYLCRLINQLDRNYFYEDEKVLVSLVLLCLNCVGKPVGMLRLVSCPSNEKLMKKGKDFYIKYFYS